MKTLKKISTVTFLIVTSFLYWTCTTNETAKKKEPLVKALDTRYTKLDTTYKSPESKYMMAAGRVVHDTITGWTSCSDPCGPCDNSARYPSPLEGGGREISPESGREMVSIFHSAHEDIIKGGFISKVALDAIFCNNETYNGIYCYVAQDASGYQRIVIEGWRDDSNGESRTRVLFDSSIPAADRYKVFETQLMCPTVCGYCGE